MAYKALIGRCNWSREAVVAMFATCALIGAVNPANVFLVVNCVLIYVHVCVCVCVCVSGGGWGQVTIVQIYLPNSKYNIYIICLVMGNKVWFVGVATAEPSSGVLCQFC